MFSYFDYLKIPDSQNQKESKFFATRKELSDCKEHSTGSTMYVYLRSPCCDGGGDYACGFSDVEYIMENIE